MCGIAGLISKDPSWVSPARVRAMTDALAHRGPDGEGHWYQGQTAVALGHRRLAIIDLSDHGVQPMPYGNRYRIIHNGEIYNYIELKEELRLKGHVFRTQTDTEVIAASFMEYGNECVQKMDGMFSFAIWDEKEQQLFAAVDRFGEKPFYYYLDENQFLFASEMKALWAAGIPRTVNQKMLFNFLTIGYVDNPNKPEETFFEKISRLAPAHTLRYDLKSHEIELEKYWDIDFNFEVRLKEEDAIGKFTELLETSVKRRLRSDVPIGTSLSGGLDSSTIAFFSGQLKSPRLSYQSFSAVFPGYEKNEEPFIDLAGKQFNLQTHKTSVSAGELPALLEKIFYYQEEPFSSASVLAQYKVYAMADEQHIKVLLDGQGADETLAGYHKYYKWYWQELFRKRKLISSGELGMAHKLGVTERFGLKNIVASLFPEFASVILERQYLVNALQHDDLSPDFIQKQSREAYFMTPTILRLKGVLYFNTCMHGLSELLRYADRNSMANGREVRLPFLSHELVEFIFSLPPSFKIRKGWTKWILRKAMETHLPAGIAWRTDKTGFEPPQQSFMEDKRVQDLIRDSQRILVDQQVLKRRVLDKKIQPHSAYAADHYEWRYLISAFLFR
jgi:asparagine synthase (glutamine-hydrolysing)